MEFQIAEAVELIKTLAETENLTLNDALVTFVAEAELDIEYAKQLKGALFERYSLKEMAEDSLTKALFNVFTGEGTQDIQEVDTKETADGTKYKIRVADRESGSSYVRYATREKIAELRANPNISSVELTDYGSTGEDDRGQKTAAAKGGGGGRDYDGDGKRESSSKEHAGVVHNAIQRAKGGKPDGRDTRREGVEVPDALKNRRYKTDGKKVTSYEKDKDGKEKVVHTREEVEVDEAMDFKGARRVDDARKKEQDEKDKKSPSSKDARLALGKFRPGASNKERAEGGRDVMREKGTSPTKKGKKMFEAYLERRAAIAEMRHRDAETGEVTDKPEIGKTYYPDGPRQKSSVALRKEKEAAAKKKVETKEEWRPDPTEKRAKKAEKLHRDETIESGKRDRDRDDAKVDKLYKRRQAVQSKTKMRKEEYIPEADLMDAGRENSAQRTKPGSASKPPAIKGTGVDNSDKIRLMPKMSEAVVIEKAESKSQQRLMGMVRAAQKGDLPNSSDKVKELAKSMGMSDVKDFAKTKHDELPEKKEEKKESVVLDEFGMPILEMSTNNARPGPSKEMIDPPADPNGDVGHMNPKGKAKRYKERGEAPGDRRPNDTTGPDLPNEKGTVPNGAGA